MRQYKHAYPVTTATLPGNVNLCNVGVNCGSRLGLRGTADFSTSPPADVTGPFPDAGMTNGGRLGLSGIAGLRVSMPIGPIVATPLAYCASFCRSPLRSLIYGTSVSGTISASSVLAVVLKLARIAESVGLTCGEVGLLRATLETMRGSIAGWCGRLV